MSGAPTYSSRLDWQACLFGERPKRRELLQLEPAWGVRALRCRVHRNHGFELVASVAAPYLAFAGYGVEFVYSDYDDALSFQLEGHADLELVWLDLAHYDAGVDVAAWLDERMAFLCERSSGPVLLVTLDNDGPIEVAEISGLFATSLATIQDELGEGFFDARTVAHTGSRLSGAASIAVARRLGSQWLPALFEPPTKALVLDLDHTLYAGVLGEDGAEGISLTAEHAALQEHIRSLNQAGMFLALASRNERDDVRRMFELRTDFPLRWDDFSYHGIGWGSKSESIAGAARALRISTDAMLFIDDNPGELLRAAADLPDLPLLHAGSGGADTLRALRDFPGLFKWRQTSEDALRVRDLAATAERSRVAGAAGGDRVAYLASLALELAYEQDRPGAIARAAELTAKTNQFNLALARTDERELESYVAREDRTLVTVALKDRLSDSGVIAVLAAHRAGTTLVIDELCISCRALGREIESLLILTACAAMARTLETTGFEFRCAEGPRNAPALDWVKSLEGIEWVADGRFAQLTTLPPIETRDVTLLGLRGVGTDK